MIKFLKVKAKIQINKKKTRNEDKFEMHLLKLRFN